MTDSRPFCARLRRAAWIERALWVAFLLCLWGWAAHLRLGLLAGTPIDVDWGWFLRVGSQTAHGQAWVGPAMFMYTTLPSLLFGLLGRLCGSGQATVVAWTVLGAAAAPLTALAVRRVAGPPAALVAGAVVAVSATQIWVTTGLKSPYFIAASAALLALGLADATHRRWWGPFLVAQGATLTAALHIGVAPAAALAVLLGLLHLPRLAAGRDRWLGAAGWLLGTLPITGWVLYVDRARLLRDLALHAERPWQSEGSARALLDRLEGGLSLELSSLPALQVGAGLGLLGFAGWWAWRRTKDPPADVTRFVVSGWTGLQALLLSAAALAPYLYQLVDLGYFETHHAISVVPLALVAVAGLARCVGPPRPRLVGWLIAAAVLLPWLQDARVVPPPKPTAPLPLHHTAAIFHLEAAVRGAMGHSQPVVVGWQAGQAAPNHDMPVRTLSELVRVGRWTADLAPTCFVLTDPGGAALLPGLVELTVEPRSGVILLHDPGCALLPGLAETLCDEGDGRTIALRHDYGGAIPEQELLPECYGRARQPR